MNAPQHLVADLLMSLEGGPKPYREIMEAWRTSCPRLPVWEDAVEFGFVQRDRDRISLTETGRDWLRAAARPARV